MSKVYQRTEDDSQTTVTVKEAMAEVNHAQMDGKREVREMSSGRGQHSIQYKDGRQVRLIEVDASPKGPVAKNIQTHTGKVHAPGRYYKQLRGVAPKCCASASAVMRYHYTAEVTAPVDCQRCLNALAKEA